MTSGKPELILTIDVAHPPMQPDRVEEILSDCLGRVRASPHLRILKVIHGYGHGGTGSKTRTIVLNWTYRNRSRMRVVISGNEYLLSQPQVQKMRVETGNYHDDDLNLGNPGITVCWVK